MNFALTLGERGGGCPFDAVLMLFFFMNMCKFRQILLFDQFGCTISVEHFQIIAVDQNPHPSSHCHTDILITVLLEIAKIDVGFKLYTLWIKTICK